MDALAVIIYDDVTNTYTQLDNHVEGFGVEIAKGTLAQARIALTFLAKCGMRDSSLEEEVDVLQQIIKQNE